jgi:hypothetical protein
VAPILVLPTAGDLLTVSSILQAFKALADWSAWASTRFLQLRGIFAWISSTTYQAGNVAIDDLDQHIYRALSTNGNMQPSTSPSVWERIDWSSNEVAANSGVLVTATSGIVASKGATVSAARMLSFCNGAIRVITFSVDTAPVNNYTDIDLNGSDVGFTSIAYMGQVTLAQTGSNSVGQLGLAVNSGGDKNVVRLACNLSYSLDDHTTTNYSASITLWGA